MLLPLSTSTRSRALAWATWLLALATVSVHFAVQADLNSAVDRWGLIPSQLFDGSGGIPWTLLSHAFLHADVWHLGVNVWFLVVFGTSVEQWLRGWRLLIAYAIATVCAALVHASMNPQQSIPCVGASGAVSGLLGCYLVFEGLRVRVLSLGPLLLLTETPGWFFVVVWFIFQLEGISRALFLPDAADHIAWFAHVGGFAAGLLFGLVIRSGLRPGAARRNPVT